MTWTNGIRRTDYQVNTTAEVGAHTFAFAAADVVRGGALDVEELPSRAAA